MHVSPSIKELLQAGDPGLANLALQDRSRMQRTLDLLMSTERTGTPAMRARSRKLLRQLTGHAEARQL